MKDVRTVIKPQTVLYLCDGKKDCGKVGNLNCGCFYPAEGNCYHTANQDFSKNYKGIENIDEIIDPANFDMRVLGLGDQQTWIQFWEKKGEKDA